ncbi:ShlB/FhaC/HecB family hemolysin secretion/activation protein [Bordetella tumbae]
MQAHLTMRLVDLGLITAWVRVPEQSLAEGSLTLRYGAGRISEVRSEGAPGWWRTVLPSGPGDELNQRDLDQALENIQRLKGQSDARIDIAPGTALGASDVLLQPGSGKRWHAYIGGDNAGLKTMGNKRLNAGLTVDSPLFLYDQLSVSWNSNAGLRNHDNNTRAASVYYSVPFGYWTMFASAGRSRYRQTVSGFEEPIVYGGTTQQVDAGVLVVPYRGSHNKGTIVAKVLRKRVGGTLNGIDIEVQRRDVMGYELGYQHRHYVGRTVVDAGAGMRGTVPRYSKQPGYVYGDPGWDGRTTILAATAGAYMPFTLAQQQMAYQFNWQFQHAKTPIVPADYFTIGDRYTVRGFDGQMTLTAEDGWSLRNDLSWNLSTLGQQLYAGVDAGRVSGPSAQYLSGRTLVGAVAGLRGRISVPYIDTSYDVSLGWPLKKPDAFPTSNVVFAAALMFEF